MVFKYLEQDYFTPLILFSQGILKISKIFDILYLLCIFFNQIGFLSELFWNSVYPFKAFISIIRYNSRFYSSSIKIEHLKNVASDKQQMLDIIPKLFSHEFFSCFFLNFENCIS